MLFGYGLDGFPIHVPLITDAASVLQYWGVQISCLSKFENLELHIDSILILQLISFLKGDFFDLDDNAINRKFDVIFDRGSIVAIDPS